MDQFQNNIDVEKYIKRIIYSLKKSVYNIFRWKIVVKDINEIPPEVIINSVLFAAYQEYSDKRKKITITRAVKLIISAIEKMDYHRISYGCYKYGEFSFVIHGITRPIFITRSLHGAKIDKKMVRMDIVELGIPVVRDLKSIMTGSWKRFNRWAHEDRIPIELQALYSAHDRFEITLSNMESITKKIEFPTYQETISDIISDLDNELNNVNDEVVKLYFEYTGIFEGFLLATKYHDFNFSHAKKLYSELMDLYNDEISSLIFPFEETIKGDNRQPEESAYLDNSHRKLSNLHEKLLKIKKDAETYNLKPTIDELDNEIVIELNKLGEPEKRELLYSLTT